MKTYEDMTLEELEDNEDEFNEEDERAIEMYRLVQSREIVRFFVWHQYVCPLKNDFSD